jgi:hypothetical protein
MFELELPVSWPSRPPRGAGCDASVGCGVDVCGQPVVVGCSGVAVETVLSGGGVVSVRELWLCGGVLRGLWGWVGWCRIRVVGVVESLALC